VAHLGLEPIAPDIVVDSMIVDSGTVSSAIAKLFTDTEIKSQGRGHRGQRSLCDREENFAAVHERPGTGGHDSEGSRAAHSFRSRRRESRLSDSFRRRHNPQMDVLLVAVKKDKILNYTNVLSMAGKTPAIVDIDALALQNCYEYNYEPAPTQVVALLNLGASVMNINIVKGTTPLFPRERFGGRTSVHRLAAKKELDLSFDDAESLKLGPQGRKPCTTMPRRRSCSRVTEIIVLEIQKTFDFFRPARRASISKKIYLAGGSARFRVWWKRYARNSPCRWNCSIRSRKCWRPSMGRLRNWWNRMPVS